MNDINTENLKNKTVISKKSNNKQIISMALWFVAIFAVGLLFKGLLSLTDNGKVARSQNALIEGVEHITKNNYKTAMEFLNQAVKLDTTNTFAYIYRGRAYFKLDKYDEALSDFNKAIVQSKENYEPYIYRADLYYKQDNYSGAFNDYSKAIEICPTDDAFVGKGNVYLKMGNPTEAIANYTEAIDLKPENAEIYFIRGNAYNQQGMYNEAINDFDQAIKLNPNEAKYKQNRDFAEKLKTKS